MLEYLGRLDEALQVYRRLIPRALEVETEPRRRATYLNNYGRLFLDLGQADQALHSFRAAVEVLTPVQGSDDLRATCLNNVGVSLQQSGAVAEAGPVFEQALALDTLLAHTYNIARDCHNLGAVHRALAGRASSDPGSGEARAHVVAAHRYFHRAIRLMERQNRQAKELATYRSSLGGLLYEQRKHRYAIGHYRRALVIATRHTGGSLIEARIHNNLAYALLGRGRAREALDEFTRAIRIHEGVYRRHQSEIDRRALLEDSASPYKGAIAALYTLGRERHEEGAHVVGASWSVAEQYRARVLHSLLVDGVRLQAELPDADPVEPLRRQVEESRATLERLRAGLTETGNEGGASPLAIADLAREEQVAGDAQEKLSARLRGIAPLPSDVDPAEVQRALAPNELLLSYFLHGDDAYCWAFRADRCCLLPVAGSDAPHSGNVLEIERDVRLLAERGEIRAREQDPRLSRAERHALETRRSELWMLLPTGLEDGLEVAARQRLSQALLDPVPETMWEGVEHVTIIPHGALTLLAFDTLRRAQRGLLCEEVSITYVPSWSVASLLRRRTVVRPRAPAPSCLFVSGPGVPDHRRESQALRELFGDGLATARTRAELASACNRHSVLHFRAHGTADVTHPMRGFLHLHSDGGKEPREDPHLRVHQVFGLKLQADLVVLSACSSGLGKLYLGDGMLGLPYAFLVAGAQCLIVTLWPVNPFAMGSFNADFYEHLAKGATIRAAFQAARLRLREAVPDPWVWGAPVLIGLGDQAIAADRARSTC